MAYLLENLLEMGNHDITYGALNTVKHRKHLDDFKGNFRSNCSQDLSRRYQSYPNERAIQFFNNKPFNTIRFYVHSMVNWVQGFETDQFDVVILEGAFMGDYLPLAKIIGKKVVLRSHNLEHVIWERVLKFQFVLKSSTSH